MNMIWCMVVGIYSNHIAVAHLAMINTAGVRDGYPWSSLVGRGSLKYPEMTPGHGVSTCLWCAISAIEDYSYQQTSPISLWIHTFMIIPCISRHICADVLVYNDYLIIKSKFFARHGNFYNGMIISHIKSFQPRSSWWPPFFVEIVFHVNRHVVYHILSSYIFDMQLLLFVMKPNFWNERTTCWWLNVRLQYLQRVSNGDTTFLLLAISICHVDGLVQDYSISSALAMEILQSCTKPTMYSVSNAAGLIS